MSLFLFWNQRSGVGPCYRKITQIVSVHSNWCQWVPVFVPTPEIDIAVLRWDTGRQRHNDPGVTLKKKKKQAGFCLPWPCFQVCSSNSENTHHGCHQIPKLSFFSHLKWALWQSKWDVRIYNHRYDNDRLYNDRWKLKSPYKTKTYVVLSWLLPSAAVSIVSAYSKVFLGCGDAEGWKSGWGYSSLFRVASGHKTQASLCETANTL